MSVCDVRVGQTCIHDLKRDPVAVLDEPTRHLFFIYRAARWMRSPTTRTRRKLTI
jgi:hypothetical protein